MRWSVTREGNWMSWVPRSVVAKASSRAPSLVKAAVSFWAGHVRGAMIRVAIARCHVIVYIFQALWTKPSTSTVSCIRPLLVMLRVRCSS